MPIVTVQLTREARSRSCHTRAEGGHLQGDEPGTPRCARKFDWSWVIVQEVEIENWVGGECRLLSIGR